MPHQSNYKSVLELCLGQYMNLRGNQHRIRLRVQALCEFAAKNKPTARKKPWAKARYQQEEGIEQTRNHREPE